MATLAEIESAIYLLAPAEQEALLLHLEARVRRHQNNSGAAEREQWMERLDALRASIGSGIHGSEQMISESRDNHIVRDENGIARVAASRSKITQIVCDLRSGMTPEMIQEAYPHLSLAQIYAALSYYHDHNEQLDAQIEQSTRFADSMRSHAPASPTKTELRERLA